MADNVFILGAGFSAAAGIPLLNGFIDKMLDYHYRRRTCVMDNPSPEEYEIIREAIALREELDSYHGRANFDDRNIEDILSILSFEALAGNKNGQDKLAVMTRAIATTINPSCTVKYNGFNSNNLNKIEPIGPDVYREFWKGYFSSQDNVKELPTIITFNYDLVLERSLFHSLTAKFIPVKAPFPYTDIRLLYHCALCSDMQYKVSITPDVADIERDGVVRRRGYRITEIPFNSSNSSGSSVGQIDLLKLHGSLNFQKNPEKSPEKESDTFDPTQAVAEPFILPPIFDKTGYNSISSIWEAALGKIRKAKHIIIVGYSLPLTDIYMQYFFKAALGPNRDLQKIIVFDPVLFKAPEAASEMKARYEACFAPQLRPRIEFLPEYDDESSDDFSPGSTDHFVDILRRQPSSLLFS